MQILIVPLILSGLFCGFAFWLHALSAPLAALILAYTLAPSICAFLIRRSPAPAWADFAIIAFLWFPLEFAVGARWTPKAAQGSLHIAAYVVAVTLALVLFSFFRRLQGMKINWPRDWRDLTNPLIGFVVVAPVLFLIGRGIDFIPPLHAPSRWSLSRLAVQFLIILATTALPEEILFRGLIQNSLMQKLGATNATLFLAAFIFGCAHLDNGPGPLPNWRYMIMATIAGFVYGKVFQKSSSILASAGLHALVNTIKHNFF